jgi:hypothetical protein
MKEYTFSRINNRLVDIEALTCDDELLVDNIFSQKINTEYFLKHSIKVPKEFAFSFADCDTYTEKDFEVRTVQTDIYCKPGHRVTVTNETINYGSAWDKEKANDLLKVGHFYTIASTNVEGWHTDFYLEELPDFSFNSVHFVDEVFAYPLIKQKNLKELNPVEAFKDEFKVLIDRYLRDYGESSSKINDAIDYIFPELENKFNITIKQNKMENTLKKTNCSNSIVTDEEYKPKETLLSAVHQQLFDGIIYQRGLLFKLQDKLHEVIDLRKEEVEQSEKNNPLCDMASRLRHDLVDLHDNTQLLEAIFIHLSDII